MSTKEKSQAKTTAELLEALGLKESSSASFDVKRAAILEPEELQLAVMKAIEQKEAEIRLEEYKKKLMEPVRWPVYTAAELLQYIQSKGAERFKDFALDDDNREIFLAMARYFTGDPAFEKMGDGYSLSKGLLIQGYTGVGKTEMMQLFTVNQRQCYLLKTCRSVAFDYTKKDGGISALEQYSNPVINPYSNRYFGHENLGVCFDDLGTESTSQHFGNNLNVMAEVIQRRYERNLPFSMTHITTNLTADEIREYYGDRFASRARQMFNLVIFPTEAKDRRV